MRVLIGDNYFLNNTYICLWREKGEKSLKI
jgi:hypothetical protein